MSRGAHAATKERPSTLQGRPRVSPPPPLARPRPSLDSPRPRLVVRRHWAIRLSIWVVVLAVLAGFILGAINLLGGSSTPSPERSPSYRTPGALLVQVRAADGGAAASVLLSTDATDTGGSAVLLPSRVIAAVPGGGQQPLGSVLSSHDGISLSRSTVSDLLGVRVDASWVLNPVGFVALVNAVGGITADVDVDVDTTVNGIPVLVPQGERQKLDGMQAAAVLLYRPSSEDEIAAQPRVQHILDAVLGELPSGTELDKLLAALPEGSRPGDPISDYLEPLAQVSSAGLMLYQTLPIAPLDVDGRAIYRADSKGVAAMVKDSFPASELATGQIGSRVLVLNATGAPGLGELVRDRIVPAGFGFAGSRNQTPFGQKTTVIVVFDSAPESLARGKRLATALGLPNAPVQVSDRAQSVADLLVVVGSDFRP